MKTKRKYRTMAVNQVATRKLILVVDQLRQISKTFPATQPKVSKINNLLRGIMSEMMLSPLWNKRFRVKED